MIELDTPAAFPQERPGWDDMHETGDFTASSARSQILRRVHPAAHNLRALREAPGEKLLGRGGFAGAAHAPTFGTPPAVVLERAPLLEPGDVIMNAREDSIGYYDSGVRRRWLFEDRADAGRQLADALIRYRGRNAVVLAIPRGGVPVASEVARRLDADLDVIVARKLGAPGQSELAIGAVAADGSRWLNRELVRLTGASDAYLHAIADEQRGEAERRERRFRAGLAPFDPVGRIAIVVDDGLATGATMRAALRSLRRRGAERTVVAVPVGSADACESISPEVDELVCPHRPDPFYAVGQHYARFDQTSDEEVEYLLREQRERRARSAAPAHSMR